MYLTYLYILYVNTKNTMLYQLQDGRTIEISLNEYLTLSDEEINNLKEYNFGIEINDPKFGSIITKPGRNRKEDMLDYSEEDDDEGLDYDPDY